MKKVIYITGTRAEYGVMESLLQKMQASGAFDVSLIVTGMHLSHEHGYTLEEVKAGGLRIAAVVEGHVEDATRSGMAKSVGYEIIGIADMFEREKPDLVLLAGDRDEPLAAAIAAAHLNIPIAHISGGDTTTGGTIDDRIRHAITKFSDIHFPAKEQSAAIVISMGENAELVFPVGTPGVHTSYVFNNAEKSAIAEKYTLDRTKPILLVTQHPVTSTLMEAGEQMRETLEALKTLQFQSVLIYPNADAGNADMVCVITEYEKEPYLRIYKNIPREDFVDLMGIASVMVGNSSAALIEAPSFLLPAVNIGSRQEG
ncbi:MAG: UDP-N-acetylglucosamine 2-epimerase [Candidatus Uhrbacteria bacterium]|nr:UDP-N-acetylglucosamine 2-epimerase [Candidatus Uhrbacteria bacterium]